jgi:hypothetical protein
MTHRGKLVAYLFPLIAVALAGCGSNTTAGRDTSSRAALSAATGSSDPSVPTRPVASATKPTAASPSPARDGDVDGDGRVDRVTVVQSGGGWRLTAIMTRLGTQSLQLAGTTRSAPSVEGVVDLDHDGHAEVSLLVDHGASTSFSSIVRLVGKRLVQLKGPDGTIAKLDSGGSVTHIAVWGCRASGSPGQLWQWAGTSDTGSATYSGTERTLAIRDDTLVTTSSTSFQNQQPPAGGCGSLHI